MKFKASPLWGASSRLGQKLELGLAFAIQEATKMSDLMRSIVCANMSLREKLSTLRTIVDVSTLSDEEKTKFKKDTA